MQDNFGKRAYLDVLKSIPIGNVKEREASKFVNNVFPSTSYNVKENPYAISRKALRAKASKRIRKLAQPKKLDNKCASKDPYKVSEAALKAKPNQRIIELAQPKKYIDR